MDRQRSRRPTSTGPVQVLNCIRVIDGIATVDVKRANITVSVPLNGEAISELNSSNSDEGEIRLQHSRTGELIELSGVWNGATNEFFSPYTLSLVPGDYLVTYSVVADGPNWPGNTGTLLERITVEDGGNYTIDVQRANFDLTITLNGQPVSELNTGDFDEGAIAIRHTTTRKIYELGSLWDDALDVPLANFALSLVPGEYDVIYSSLDNGANWPDNESALVGRISVANGGKYVVDVQRANATLGITLNGTPVSALNSNSNDRGSIGLRQQGTDEMIQLGVATETACELNLVAGLYDVFYQVVNDGPNWPDNQSALLTTLAVEDGGVYTVDVERKDITLAITLNGKEVTALNAGDLDEGRIQLQQQGSADIIDFPGVWNDSTQESLANIATSLVPGTYDVFYARVDAGPNWPENEKAKLQSITISDKDLHTIDVKRADFTVSVTLNGEEVSELNTGDLDEGSLQLRRTNTGELFDLGLDGVWNDSANLPISEFSKSLIPGEYDVIYSIANNGANWPGNRDAQIDRISVGNGESYAVDVKRTDFSIKVTLNGEPVSPLNTNANDDGSILLRYANSTNSAYDFDSFGFWNPGSQSPVSDFTISLLSGVYDVFYDVDSDGANWPDNETTQIGCLLVE